MKLNNEMKATHLLGYTAFYVNQMKTYQIGNKLRIGHEANGISKPANKFKQQLLIDLFLHC